MVSVIIPNYNHSLYLQKRIDSVLNQTYQDIEVILLDDCSNDKSRDVIERYRNHPKVSAIIYNEINSASTFRQWKKGISYAKGEYIWIAESDDWASYIFLEELMKHASEATSILFCHSQRIWNEKDEYQHVEGSIIDVKSYNGTNFVNQRMLKYNSIENASMAIFRKRCVDMAWFDEIQKMRYCGDWMFWVRLSEKGDVVEINEILNYFRQHSQKVTPRAQQEGLDIIEGMQVLKYIRTHLKLRLSSQEFLYWSDLWLRLKINFTSKVKFDTCKCLLKAYPQFLFYLPISAIRRRLRLFLYNI